MSKLSIELIFSLLFFSQAFSQESFTITVEVEDIESNKGKMYFALFDNEPDFLDKRYKSAIEVISLNKSITIFKNIPSGTYAVSVFHDKNNNGKLDTNFVGVPKEDYGCSNNAKGFMGSPKWKNAKFTLNQDIKFSIKL